MKKIYRIIAVFLVLSVGSCNFIDSELNVDPNNPLDVSMNLLLPHTQVSLGYILGGDFGRYISCWTQHHSGVERQHTAVEVYAIREADVNNAWGGIYATTMKDLDIIMQKAEETNSPHYAGVAKILMAQSIGTVVDLFDAVPFSDAFRGAEQTRPTYDTGEEIYAAIQAMLTEAIADLQAATSTLSPGSSDLVFGGDRAKWIAYANTLKARYWLHLSEVNGAAYQNALQAIDAGAIAANSGNAMVTFGAAATEANPWFQFEDQRGDVVMGKFFLDLMNGINDPRRPYFASPNQDGAYVGPPAGVPDNSPAVSRFGPFYCSSASPLPLATFTEAKFIEAEAAFPTDKVRAAAAHNAAIAASLEMLGIDDPAFLADQAAETENTITLEKILTHKYIALYTTQEPFVDWRRKGIPDLQPAAGTTEIARRFPYPQDERVYNGDNYISNVTVFDRVFWDK